MNSIVIDQEDTFDSTANLEDYRKGWTNEEKDQFELAYVLYPHNWKQISLFLKTRKEDEVRNYSYKYFKRLKQLDN